MEIGIVCERPAHKDAKQKNIIQIVKNKDANLHAQFRECTRLAFEKHFISGVRVMKIPQK